MRNCELGYSAHEIGQLLVPLCGNFVGLLGKLAPLRLVMTLSTRVLPALRSGWIHSEMSPQLFSSLPQSLFLHFFLKLSARMSPILL